MKQFIAPTYTFTPGGSGVGTVNLSGISSFNVKYLVSIINQTKGIVIYSTASSTLGYTNLAGTTLTLQKDTSTMSSGDVLQVIYEVDTSAVTQPVSAASLPLPSNAATSTKQSDGSQKTQIVDGSGNVLPVGTNGNILVSGLAAVGSTPSLNPISVSGVDGGGLKRHILTDTAGRLEVDTVQSLPLPSGAATSANQSTANSSLSSIDSKTPALVAGRQPVDGSGVTQPVSAASLPLPSNAAQETGGNLASLNTKLPAQGQALMAASVPVVLASDQTVPITLPDLFITGQAAQTATVNNIIPATAGATATDCAGYRSATIQVVSTGTAGTMIFEGSNDNVNFTNIVLFNSSLATGVPINTSIGASASTFTYTFPIQTRYIRLRIVTTITGGSLQAFTKLSQATWTPASFVISQNVPTNLNVNVSSGGIALLPPTANTEVASSALTTTTTSSSLSPAFGSAQIYTVSVTAVSGTNPTLDVQVQESPDNGTTWVAVYDFPRITSTTVLYSPPIPLNGTRVRYVQTVGGTTPSFTRQIIRQQSSWNGAKLIRQMMDRTINVNTGASTSAVLNVIGCSNFFWGARVTSASTFGTLYLQGSIDGTNFFNLGGTTLTMSTSTIPTQQLSAYNVNYVRMYVQSGGSAQVLDYAFVIATQ